MIASLLLLVQTMFLVSQMANARLTECFEG
jgi:hypothetical protein